MIPQSRVSRLDFNGTVDASAPYSITEVEWFEGTDASGKSVTAPATAKAEQFYYARITLTAKSGETFAESLDNTISGDYSVTRVNDTVLTLTKAYPKTSAATLSGIDIITNPALELAVPTAAPMPRRPTSGRLLSRVFMMTAPAARWRSIGKSPLPPFPRA